MRLRLLNDSVLLDPEPVILYEGNIQMPEDNSIEKISPCARVIDVGPECTKEVRPGDRVLFKRFKGSAREEAVYQNGKKLRLVNESYLLAVVSDDLKIEALGRIRRIHGTPST